MRIQKKKWQKLAAMVTVGLMANTPLVPLVPLASVYADGETDASSSSSSSGNSAADRAEQAAKILGATGAIPVLGTNAKANYKVIVTDGYTPSVYPVCRGSGTASQNETVSFTCMVVGSKAYGVSIPITGTVAGGKQTLTGLAPFTYLYPKPDGKTWGRRTGVVSISININGYQGETTVGSGNDPWGTFGTDPYNPETDDPNSGGSGGGFEGGDGGDGGGTGLGGGDDGDDNPKASSQCPDGTYFCTSSTEPTTLFGSGGTGDGGDGGSGSGGTWGGGDGGSGGATWGGGSDGGSGGATWGGGSDGGSGGTGGYQPYDPGKDTNYGGAIDKLLNENGGAYNSKDPDWATSTGGSSTSGSTSDGSGGTSSWGGSSWDGGSSGSTSGSATSGSGASNLDDYFNGVSDVSGGGSNGNGNDIDGMTDDLLGVDKELLDGNGDGNEAFNGTGDFASDDGSGLSGDGNTDGSYNGSGDGYDTDDGSDDWGSGDGSDGSAGGLEDNAEMLDADSLQDLMNAADGISGSAEDSDASGADGAGSENGTQSLAGTISQFLKGINGPEKGVVGADATEQDLFELAKKLLMANGMSLDDILKGKSYDRGSAYTEPRQAWDMNRITTLLKSGKIKPHADEVSSNNKKSSITRASNSNRALNALKAQQK